MAMKKSKRMGDKDESKQLATTQKMKKRKRFNDDYQKMMSLSFPNEITEDIFSRVPADLLWELRYFSDYGNSLVRDSRFIQSQLNQSKKMTNRLGIMISGPSNVRQPQKFSVLKGDLTVQVKFVNAKVYGSCNGLLLLGEGSPCLDDEKLWLVNPSIGHKKKLPKPPSSFIEYEDQIASYGLGYVEDEKEFKVVRIRSSLATDTDYTPEEISAYSIQQNRWRKLKSTEACVPFTEKSLTSSSCVDNEGVFFHGALHWVGVDARHSGDDDDDDDTDNDDDDENSLNGEESDKSGAILAFDLKDEKFQNIAIPEVHFSGMKVAYLGETLSLIVYSQGYCNVWRMKEYGNSESWVKLFHVKKEFLRDSFVFRPLFYSANWCLVYDGNICLVNVKKKTLRTVHKFSQNHCDLQAVVYIDCLIPLRRQKQEK